MLKFRQLLDELGVEPGTNLYVHSSLRFLRHLELSPEQIVEGLLAHVGARGTVAMPSFWWHRDPTQRLWYTYRQTYEQAPTFDFRRDPCTVGYLAETFRRHPGTLRSLVYWYPIAAHGPLAEELARPGLHALTEHDPDSDSPLARLFQHDFHILGLGVTANTSSLTFLADVALGDRHPQQVFSSDLRVGHLIDAEGRKLEQPGYWVLPEAIQGVRPGEVIERSAGLQGEFRQVLVGEAIHFRYPARAYHREALRLGEEAVERGEKVPWLPGVPLKNSPN